MAIPLRQSLRIGAYIIGQHLKGTKRYPLVLMLEPLFRCNLACQGCGKIDYPDKVLNARLSVEECLQAAAECSAPVVTIAGGEPLLHHDIEKIVEGLLAMGKFVYLCTNALLLEKRIDRFKPHPDFAWTIHLDGGKEDHDKAVSQDGVYDTAVKGIQLAKAKGFRVNTNCTLFDGADPVRFAKYMDDIMAMGVDAVTISPGYAYERAPDTEHFLSRGRTKTLFRDIFKLGKGRKWQFSQSWMFLDFLAGNQTYHCTPWGNPTRNVFGWQRPCYLLSEGYAKTFKELLDDTDWDAYGTGNYEKCANCMVHSGYEASAVLDMMSNPLKCLGVALRGPKLDGPFVPDIPLDKQRPAEDVYDKLVELQAAELGDTRPGSRQTKSAC